MFSWLSDIIGGMGEAMGDIIKILGTELSNVIFDSLLQWLYTMIYDAIADFFTMMGNMGAEMATTTAPMPRILKSKTPSPVPTAYSV